MDSPVVLRELSLAELRPDLLDGFERRQEVRRVARIVGGQKVLRDNPFVDDWDGEERRLIIQEDFSGCLRGGGSVFGVFQAGGLVAFATLMRPPFGSRKQYVQLMQLHVSTALRRSGLGRRLFLACARRARAWGAERIYLSAHSAEETQAFYTSLGCVDAEEVEERIAACEPCDIQLEYRLQPEPAFPEGTA